MEQLTMTGQDWLSERDKKSAAKAIAARKKSALDCAKKLAAAVDALNHFIEACNDCRDNSGTEQRGISDGRVMMISDLSEYRFYLEDRYGAKD